MDRERLLRHLNEKYCSKRDMMTRIPLGEKPDTLWQELLNLRRSKSTVLPLYSCQGMPYWYVTTGKMIAASEKVVEALFENESDFDPYTETPVVSTLEEVFYTSFVEGSQMTMQEAMDFLTSELPPRDMEEQLIANNRMAGTYASENLCRRIEPELLCELVSILTEGMDCGGQEFRSTDEVDFAAADGETFTFHAPHVIRDSVNELCDFLSAQEIHPLIKAAAAQAYLIILRPFPEGNERLGRILSNMILLRAGYTFFSDVSLSALIARKGYAYFGAMVNILREENGGDLTYFMEYYLELLARAVDERNLRAQRREEQARRAEMELARTVLTVPVPATAAPVESPQPTAQAAEPPTDLTSTEAPDSESYEPSEGRGDLLDGFFVVASQERDPWPGEDQDDNQCSLARVREQLYLLTDSFGDNMKNCAKLLLRYLDDGILTFTTEDIQTDMGISQKQAWSLFTQLKDKGLIESSEERVNRLMRYRFSTKLPPLAAEEYAPEVIQAIRELRDAARSTKDRRVGEALANCIPKGIITAGDYAGIGPPAKLTADMTLPERMGIVTKLAAGVYRINRVLADYQLSLSVGQKNALSDLYRNFQDGPFTAEQAFTAINQSKTTVCSDLHHFVLLRILDCKEEVFFTYRIRMTPEEHPELYADVLAEAEDALDTSSSVQEKDDAPESPSFLQTEPGLAIAQDSDFYADEVYEMISTLSASTTSNRDRRLADVLTRCLGKGLLLQSEYEMWGFTQNMWLSDMKLAKQLGLARKLSPGVYAINKRLKPELLPQQKKTVSAIYETFGDQKFSSEMFIATLNYSISYTYASLHKLTLLRILDQRSTDEGSQYQLRVTPEDHPECFEPAA